MTAIFNHPNHPLAHSGCDQCGSDDDAPTFETRCICGGEYDEAVCDYCDGPLDHAGHCDACADPEAMGIAA